MTGKRFGHRGEAWVAAQLFILVLLVLAPHVGPAWPKAVAFQWAGGALVLAAIVVLGKSVVVLGRSLTPFPKPLPNA